MGEGKGWWVREWEGKDVAAVVLLADHEAQLQRGLICRGFSE